MPDPSDLLRHLSALAAQFPDWTALKQHLSAVLATAADALQHLGLHEVLLIWGTGVLTTLCITAVRMTKQLSRLATKQLHATSDLARAVDVTAALQRDINERQLRAYVDVAAVSFQRFAPGQEIVVHVEMRNHGLTPALGVIAQVQLSILPFPASDLPALKPLTDIAPVTLAARETRSILQRLDIQALPGAAERVLAGEVGIYAVGKLTYADVFGQTHVTTACLVASGERVRGRLPFARCEDGNLLS